MEKAFKLFASCLPVKGAARSVVCDLQGNKIKFIPNSLCDLLLDFDGKSPQEVIDHYGEEHREVIEEYYAFLIEHDLGFWCQYPELFPKMDLNWEVAAKITNGIIDINKNSKHDFKQIFAQYDALGCHFLQLRFYDVVSISYLSKQLSFLDKTGINSVELTLKYSAQLSSSALEKLAFAHLRINHIGVHSAPRNEEVAPKFRKQRVSIQYHTEEIQSNTHCGNISKEYFSINQQSFLESLQYNSCLNKKLSIDVDGALKNCPTLSNSYGNIQTNTLEEGLNASGFKDTWSINKTQIEVCKECEFRHICTDCRAFHNADTSLAKPKKCSYNPKTMQWEDGQANAAVLAAQSGS